MLIRGLGAATIINIQEKVAKIRGYIQERIPEAGRLQGLFIFWDVVWSSWVYGGAIDDYFHYNFFKRNHAGRKDFFLWRKRKKTINICNNKQDRDVFNNKARFNKAFYGFIGREWLDTTKCSLADFLSFAEKNSRFFVKPLVGSFGHGARLVELSDNPDLEGLFHSLRQEEALVEEVIRQLPEMAAFNPSSVNTLRLVTLLGADGTVRVKTATFRCGQGSKCVDNLFQGGMAASVDLTTGIVSTTAVDIKSRRFVLHPVSGKAVVGYQIPFWDKIVATVMAAAQVVPSVRYVGWDVALDREGSVVIVEGNSAADADIAEMPDQIGKWPLYKDEIRRIDALNKPKKPRGRDLHEKDKSALF